MHDLHQLPAAPLTARWEASCLFLRIKGLGNSIQGTAANEISSKNTCTEATAKDSITTNERVGTVVVDAQAC